MVRMTLWSYTTLTDVALGPYKDRFVNGQVAGVIRVSVPVTLWGASIGLRPLTSEFSRAQRTLMALERRCREASSAAAAGGRALSVAGPFSATPRSCPRRSVRGRDGRWDGVPRALIHYAPPACRAQNLASDPDRLQLCHLSGYRLITPRQTMGSLPFSVDKLGLRAPLGDVPRVG